MFLQKGNCRTVHDVMKRNHKDLEQFMNPEPHPDIVHLKEAVAFLREHKDLPIHIIGDYDVDGVCSTTILKRAIASLGCQVTARLPKRMSEGYGLSEKIIDEIDSGLIITVDNGIAAIDPIKKAKEKGLLVIVIDHHLPPQDDRLPEADVIVDPWVFSGYTGYCGAGLAYRFAEELLPGKNLKAMKVLASIATVADVMPLTGANRVLLKEGLELINKRQCYPGLKELLKQFQLDEHITEDDYGFSLGPAINAPGRLYDDGASKPLALFLAGYDDYQIPWKCSEIIALNEKRKQMIREAMESVDFSENTHEAIVVYHEDWEPGLVGLIAGRIREKANVPVIALTKQNDVWKGSGRSVPGISLKEKLNQIADDMVHFGGHAGAVGVTVAEKNLEKFIKDFKKVCGRIPDVPETTYDLELSFDLEKQIEELKKYAPFGNGNPKIRYHFYFPMDHIQTMGDGTHFRAESLGIEIIGFGLYEKYLAMDSPSVIEAVGFLNEKWFNGTSKIQIELLDFCPA